MAPWRHLGRSHKSGESFHIIAEGMRFVVRLICIDFVLGVFDFVELRYAEAVGRVLLRVERAGNTHLVEIRSGAEVNQRRFLTLPAKAPGALHKFELELVFSGLLSFHGHRDDCNCALQSSGLPLLSASDFLIRNHLDKPGSEHGGGHPQSADAVSRNDVFLNERVDRSLMHQRAAGMLDEFSLFIVTGAELGYLAGTARDRILVATGATGRVIHWPQPAGRAFIATTRTGGLQ